MKHDWKPGTMIYPLPAVMVSCGNEPSEYNIITQLVSTNIEAFFCICSFQS